MGTDTTPSKGRSLEQQTNGSTSAGSMGAGSTGNVAGNVEGNAQNSNAQAGRTDDLLSSGEENDTGARGFQPVQRDDGGNRQSEARGDGTTAPGAQSATLHPERPSDDAAAPHQGAAAVPASTQKP